MEKQLQFNCPHCNKVIIPDHALTKKLEIKLWPDFSAYVSQESKMKLREKEKVINDLKKQLGLALKKAEQVPNELLGSAQEEEITEILTRTYPNDTIQRIRKGGNGADILHTVKTAQGTEVGKIYYESKKTLSYSGHKWSSKLKKDNLAAKANALVIVTSTLPKEVSKFALIDGIWICDVKEIKEFSFVLRYILTRLAGVATIESDKANKMAQLYRYITSDDFKTVFSSIFSGFQDLRNLHVSERLKIQKVWKEREILLEQILSSSLEMHGYFRAIVGPDSLPELKPNSLPLQD